MDSAEHRDAAGIRVLIVEDDTSARTGLIELVKAWGFDTIGAVDGEDALEQITAQRPDIVLADLVMPRRDGLSLLRALSDHLSELTFVMVTAQGSVEGAVAAMKDGAYDYLTKPIDPQRLRVLLERLVERHDSRREIAALKRELVTDSRLGQIIGKSAAIRKVYRLVEQTAPSPASVLIYGESGTGKELVAAAVHKLSPRASSPFVAINCAAIPEGLLESEVFGHERGAFTGAISQRQGCFELAHRGTLFLDEVAEMAPLLQAKLLRVLQERTVRRLGGTRDHPFDVRIVAATNTDPKVAIRDGRLRDDLYYRINVVSISLPPLRERVEDVPLLVQAFLPEFNRHRQRPVQGVTQDALRALKRYSWPGNVRELRNVVERAVILSSGDLIEMTHLPPDLVSSPVPPSHQTPTLTAGMRVDQAERHLIEMTLEHTGNNKTRAAEMLGISVKTLHNKLNKFRAEAGT
jgi:DNA-binding NtrC family response regulator